MKLQTIGVAVAWAFILGSSKPTHDKNPDITVGQSNDQILVRTPELIAGIQKKGYVSGIAGGSFVDRKTGFHDAGFGLDIVDWIMEPGSDEAYRDQLPPEMVYRFGNMYHGNMPKRSIEGPQIC